MEAKLFHSLTPTKPPLLPTPWKNPWLPGTQTHLPIRLKPLVLGPIQSNNNNANANETTNPVTPPPPEAVEIRFRKRSSRRRDRDGDGDGNGRSSSPSPAKKEKEKKKKKWEEMSAGEKALELYVGEKGALYWLNKFAYASIYIIIGAWILFRFVGPALNLYQLDAPPLSPESILKG